MVVLPYVQTSVFVDDRHAFGGNQLATFWDEKTNAKIDSAIMQGIALEMNFSETTFIVPSKLDDCVKRVRIFTPANEIPFAGHPTLGTAFVLKHKEIIPSKEKSANLELEIGAIPILYLSPNIVSMTQPRPQYLEEFKDRLAIAHTVGLSAGDIATTYPMQFIATGHPFLIVPVGSLEAIQRAQPNASLILDTLENHTSSDIVLISTDTIHEDSDVHVRMFAPAVGVLEDPATGSAAGPIAAYLEYHNVLKRKTKGLPIKIEQGYEIHRPSQLLAEVVWEKEPESVLVSGKVKLIAEGKFYVDT